MNFDYLFNTNPYCLGAREKQAILTRLLWELTLKHKKLCEPYQRILEALPISLSMPNRLEDIPMLPTHLFKIFELYSVPQDSITRILTSSGTTSQVVSRIFLDKETSILQTKALVSIMKSFIGNKRLPLILVDAQSILREKALFSARWAGLLGLSLFGHDNLYLLDDSMNIRWKELDIFLEKYSNEKILLFGFTFMIWQYLYQPCVEKGYRLKSSNSILIHSGGWKKLEEIAVDNETFKSKLKDQLGIKKIHSFYGMAEQLGSIFMECEESYLHTPDFADIIVRNPISFEPLPKGHAGLIQTLSILPQSYPGHSLLTEDLGIIFGEDDCRCRRKGKYFVVQGRLPSTELRGCSDTHAYDNIISH